MYGKRFHVCKAISLCIIKTPMCEKGASSQPDEIREFEGSVPESEVRKQTYGGVKVEGRGR